MKGQKREQNSKARQISEKVISAEQEKKKKRVGQPRFHTEAILTQLKDRVDSKGGCYVFV